MGEGARSRVKRIAIDTASGGRKGGREGVTNRLGDIIRATKHIVIPYAEYTAAVIFQPPCAPVIVPFVFFFRVLPTIHFNDQSRFGAEKICDVRPNLHLATETESGKLFAAKH